MSNNGDQKRKLLESLGVDVLSLIDDEKLSKALDKYIDENGRASNLVDLLNATSNEKINSSLNDKINQARKLKSEINSKRTTSSGEWTCECGTKNTGKFCNECGKSRPDSSGEWTCECGTKNTGKFCSECGKSRPDSSGEWTCECGTKNKGNFCSSCGTPRVSTDQSSSDRSAAKVQYYLIEIDGVQHKFSSRAEAERFFKQTTGQSLDDVHFDGFNFNRWLY